MKNAMQKDFWREIQHTRSRFFSIMILVALSVAFLSGLKATAPDMKKTGDDYLDSLYLADIQVLSTLGLTDDDITSLRAQDKVEDAEGEYVIEDKTRDAIRANVSCFEYAEKGKLFSELSRIVMGKYAARVLEQYSDILKFLLPEIEPCIGFDQHSVHHDFDVWTHICKSVGYAVPELPVRFAMLFHDLGKPDCCAIDSRGRGHFKGHGERGRLIAERIMRRLEFPAALSEEISWLVFYHDKEIPESRADLKRLLDALGAEDLRKLIQCEIADSRAKKLDTETPDVQRLRAAAAALREILDSGECYNIRQLAITQRELMERRLVTNEQEAEQLINALFDMVLDKPSFNNKLMLLDMAEKSKQRLEEIRAERERIAAEKRAAQALKHKKTSVNRRNEPVYTRKKQ